MAERKDLDGVNRMTSNETLSCSENPNSLDTISRQAAIDEVDSEKVSTNPEHFKSSEKFIKFMDDADIASFGLWKWANGFNTALVATKVSLKKLPAAQPERERGRWIKHERGYWTFVNKDGERDGWIPDYECSECGSRGWKYADNMNFCPQCGADMREDTDE